jgi:hypothetical protein
VPGIFILIDISTVIPGSAARPRNDSGAMTKG